MAVVVTDLRTIRNEADSTTGWTGSGGTSTSVFAEAPSSVISTLNIATGQVYHTGTAINLSNTLVYVWSNNFALQGDWDAANPANALHLGDGTNRISFKMAGTNRKVFAHLDSGPGIPVDWDCLVLDGSQASTMNSAGLTVARAGSFASLNLSAITQIGSDFTTLSKGIGGGINVAVDIIRYGNDGIQITGGTTGDRGKFFEIVNEDRSTANQKAHGIIRELGTGLYSAQGPLNFGSSASALDSWFDDTGRVLLFENRNISNDKYYIRVRGNASSANHFILRNSTVTTAGPFVRCDFNGGNINTLTLSGCNFSGLGNAITFSSAADAAGHTVTGCTFQGCGRIDPGLVTFQDNTISNSTDAGGAFLIDSDGTANISDVRFVSGGTGHAILITATGTYTFDALTYTGYGANDTTDAAVYNNSGGAVTINVTGGGGSPTVRNGTGASTTVNNVRSYSISNIQPDSEIRIYDASDTTIELAGSESVTGSLTRVGVTFGGSGYTNGDVLTLVGGTFTTAAQVLVTGVSGGVITSVSIQTGGSYTASPPNPTSVTGGTGTGALLSTTVRGTFTYLFNFNSILPVTVVLFHLNYKDLRLNGTSLLNSDQTIPIQQIIDRVYSNP